MHDLTKSISIYLLDSPLPPRISVSRMEKPSKSVDGWGS
jgi:hypothetical protein